MALPLVLAIGSGTLIGASVWWFLTRHQRSFALKQAVQRLRSLRMPGSKAGSVRLYRHDIRYSYLPAVHHFLTRFPMAPRILLFLEQAGSDINVSSYLLLIGCCAASGVLLILWFHSPVVLGVGLAVMASLAPWLVMRAKRRRRLSRLTGQLPEATRLIASALRAGLGLESGLQIVASDLPDPIGGEFRKLLNERRFASDTDTAFRTLAKRIPTDDFRLFTACVCLHREIGGNFAQLLDQLGQTIRERFQLWRELKTLTAESRLSGWVLGFLPVAVMGAISLCNPDYFRPLFDQQVGRTMLWTGAGLQVVGFGIIRWLTTPRIH